ncbi:MAG: AMP-binding protein [Verrucomicrobia bacterium]|nr:AMP-binding protein [Verrucomicrobiota bacterium]MBT7701119.1 AMP-binding protein [Verrucomicrobiota bacterium]
MTTIKQAFVKTYQQQADRVALRYKADGAWLEITWRELMARVRQVSEILNKMKVKPGQRVAIHMDNCRQWPELYLGIVSVGCTAVPVDAKLRPQEVAHILRDSEAEAIFSSARTYPTLREIESHLPALSTAVLIDGEKVMPIQNGRIRYIDYETTMSDVREASEKDDCLFNRREPSEDDVASIIYTSGTTGRQKGAMLTHANFASNVESMMKCIDLGPSDNLLLVLPLHHAFAFTVNLLVPVFSGAQISFIQSLKTVGENTREVSPTVLVGVPLLLEKIYARIMAGLKKKPAAYFLYRAGLKAPVIKGIKQKLGGKLRFCVVGGAPSSIDTITGYAELGIPVIEGYGLTETAPVLTFNPFDAPLPGSVGKALPGVEVQIKDPNEEGIGEITARGPNIMKGYFKNPQATAEVMDGDWFLTGDMGFINEDGYVIITGRKKSLIVNREGKNIYPEEVETQILKSNFVMETIVLGYTIEGETGERVGAIVVPDEEAMADRRKHRKHPISDAELTQLMVDEVKRVTNDISDYKRPRRIQVRSEEFEKTSTSKVKRYLYAITPTEV